jgi:hypothetical protein
MHRLVIALTTLLALTGAAFVAAHLLFSQPTDLAAQLAPADTAIYINITLQPSAAQRMRIEELAQRLPGFGDVSVLDEKIDEVAQNLLGLAGLDYRRDVRPWLGDQISLLIPAGTDMSAPAVVILAAVRDADAARASLANVETSRGGDFTAADHGGLEGYGSRGYGRRKTSR